MEWSRKLEQQKVNKLLELVEGYPSRMFEFELPQTGSI